MRFIVILFSWLVFSAASATDSIELSANAQDASLSEPTSSPSSFDDKIYLLSVVRSELEQITGPNITETMSTVMSTLQQSSTKRTIWLVMIVLFASGSLFVGSVVFEVVSRRRPKRLRVKRTQRDKQTQNKNNVDHERLSKPVADLSDKTNPLLVSKLDEIEKQIREKIKNDRNNSDLHVYLFACCAAKGGLKRYEQMIKEVYPTGLDNSIEYHQHIAQLGRLVSPQCNMLQTVTDPKSAYKIQKPLFEETMQTVSQLGDVETMLDMLRVYAEMDTTVQTAQIVIEVLVQGDFKQRERALSYCRLSKKDQASSTA